MKPPVIAIFNNRGGVGKTSLVYHLAWMYADLGLRVVAADLDPQANLTAAFLVEERLEYLWSDEKHPKTIFGAIEPLIKDIGDIADPHLEFVEEGQLQYVDVNQQQFYHESSSIALLVGDPLLSGFEDSLSKVWPDCLDGGDQIQALRVTSVFSRIIQWAGRQHNADVILIDLGPNLGAINRAALIAADYIAVPLSPDPFSLQGLRNLGPTLREWRSQWDERLKHAPEADLHLPKGAMQLLGYIVLQHVERINRPTQAYGRWMTRIPGEYREYVLQEARNDTIGIKNDPHCLASLRHYRSLMPLAHEAHKPIFHLKPADGAMGAHIQAVRGAEKDFQALAIQIARRTNIQLPSSQ